MPTTAERRLIGLRQTRQTYAEVWREVQAGIDYWLAEHERAAEQGNQAAVDHAESAINEFMEMAEQQEAIGQRVDDDIAENRERRQYESVTRQAFDASVRVSALDLRKLAGEAADEEIDDEDEITEGLMQGREFLLDTVDCIKGDDLFTSRIDTLKRCTDLLLRAREAAQGAIALMDEPFEEVDEEGDKWAYGAGVVNPVDMTLFKWTDALEAEGADDLAEHVRDSLPDIVMPSPAAVAMEVGDIIKTADKLALNSNSGGEEYLLAEAANAIRSLLVLGASAEEFTYRDQGMDLIRDAMQAHEDARGLFAVRRNEEAARERLYIAVENIAAAAAKMAAANGLKVPQIDLPIPLDADDLPDPREVRPAPVGVVPVEEPEEPEELEEVEEAAPAGTRYVVRDETGDIIEETDTLEEAQMWLEAGGEGWTIDEVAAAVSDSDIEATTVPVETEEQAQDVPDESTIVAVLQDHDGDLEASKEFLITSYNGWWDENAFTVALRNYIRLTAEDTNIFDHLWTSAGSRSDYPVEEGTVELSTRMVEDVLFRKVAALKPADEQIARYNLTGMVLSESGFEDLLNANKAERPTKPPMTTPAEGAQNAVGVGAWVNDDLYVDSAFLSGLDNAPDRYFLMWDGDTAGELVDLENGELTVQFVRQDDMDGLPVTMNRPAYLLAGTTEILEALVANWTADGLIRVVTVQEDRGALSSADILNEMRAQKDTWKNALSDMGKLVAVYDERNGIAVVTFSTLDRGDIEFKGNPQAGDVAYTITFRDVDDNETKTSGAVPLVDLGTPVPLLGPLLGEIVGELPDELEDEAAPAESAKVILLREQIRGLAMQILTKTQDEWVA